jgi:hypothetical protein
MQFAEKGGLSKLIRILHDRISTIKPESQVLQWKNWIQELSSHLRLPGYADLFIKSDDCRWKYYYNVKLIFDISRDLLFKVMNDMDNLSNASTLNFFEPLQVINVSFLSKRMYL